MVKESPEILKDDHASSPVARAERLRRVRNLANLTRKQMCEGSEININTYIGYETAKYGGLPTWGGEKVIRRLSREGVFCSLDWLLYNIGQAPTVQTDYKKINSEFTTSANIDFTEIDEKKLIADEILLFRNQYKNATDFIVTDDGMLPHYKIGDYVAGINYFENKILAYLGLECIVQTRNGEMFFRVLRKSKAKENLYILSCTNPSTALLEPIMYDVDIVSAAAVIWHRRKKI